MTKKKELNHQDKKIWEDFIKNPSDIYDKEDLFKEPHRKNRYKYDLHGLTLDKANNKVKEIIEYCVKNKFKEILLITGKGLHSKNDDDTYISKDLGKLRYSVPEFINKNLELNKFIISITSAKKEDGGEGAIIIRLKNL